MTKEYFPAEQLEHIIERLKAVLERGMNVSDEAVKAMFVLQFVRNLGQRIGDEGRMIISVLGLESPGVQHPSVTATKETMREIYGNEVLPQCVIEFVRDYAEERLEVKEAKRIAEELERNIEAYFTSRNIRYEDPAIMPRNPYFDFSMPGAEELKEEATQALKGRIKQVLARYGAQGDLEGKTQEIYDRSCVNVTGSVNLDIIIQELSSIIIKRNYSELILHVGTRDPSPVQLATAHVYALLTAQKEMGFRPPRQQEIDELRKKWMDVETYRTALKDYRSNLKEKLL
jgi:hypothetical protein